MGLLSRFTSLARRAAPVRLTGGAVGERPPADGKCARCPEGLPGDDPAFAAAVTALGAKLGARNGARVGGAEFTAFTEAFTPQPGSERTVWRFYDVARRTTLGFESYARRLARRYAGCPSLLERVLDGLFHVAEADGTVSLGEMAYLERVSDLFGLSPLIFRRLKAQHLGAPADDPYVVLGVAPDAPDEAVRSAWRRALAEAHPDRAVGRGLPEAQVEAAQARAQGLNAAFDTVRRERGALLEPQAA